MKLNFSYPGNGSQLLVNVEDEKKTRVFMDKRISQEVDGGAIGDEYKGYVFRIAGGNDKQGFAMMQGVLHPTRVRLLMDERHPGYRPRRSGDRRHKSVRGCIVANDLSVLNLVVVKKGDQEIAGLTDRTLPRRLGPKRASKIRRLFNLSKKDDVRKYVIRREIPAKPAEEGKKEKKAKTKSAKIQRLVTPEVLQRKRHRLSLKKKRSAKSKEEAASFAKLISSRLQEQHDKREERLSKRREERASQLSGGTPATGAAAATTTAAAPAKTETKTAAAAAPKTETKAAAAAPKTEQKAAAPPAATKAAAPVTTAPKTETKAAAKTETKSTPAAAAAAGGAAKTEQPKAAAPKTEQKSGGKTEQKAAPKTEQKK